MQSCPSFWWHNHATLGCALRENEARFCHQGYCPLYLAHVVRIQHPKSSSDDSCQWSVAVQKWGHTAEECTNDHGRSYKYVPHKCGTESLMTSVNAATYTSTSKTLSAFGVAKRLSTWLTRSKQYINYVRYVTFGDRVVAMTSEGIVIISHFCL